MNVPGGTTEGDVHVHLKHLGRKPTSTTLNGATIGLNSGNQFDLSHLCYFLLLCEAIAQSVYV